MPDDTKRDEPVPFPVEVTVNGVKVTVTLMLKPGTTVTSEQKAEPYPATKLFEPIAVALNPLPRAGRRHPHHRRAPRARA